MRVEPQTKRDNIVTAYRISFGSRRAKQLGLIDKNGHGKQIILLKTKSGLVLRPIDSIEGALVYKNHLTRVCLSDNIHCGEVDNMPELVTWYASSPDKIEEAFHKAVDNFYQLHDCNDCN